MGLPENLYRIPGRNNWRGALIPSLESMQELKRMGIRTIVNLALDSTRKQKCPGGRYPSRPCEPMWAQELGLNYIPVYLGSSPPSASKWRKVKAALMSGNTFIHCTYGADRTGAIVGRFRLETEPGLDPRAVLQEAEKKGFKPRSHPGYPGGSGPDPNRKLREWMMAGRYQGVPVPTSGGGFLSASPGGPLAFLPGGWKPWAIGAGAFLGLLLVVSIVRRRSA
jgi:hypothetical protein